MNKKKKGTDERFLFSFKGFEERISPDRRNYTKTGAAPFSVRVYNKLKIFDVEYENDNEIMKAVIYLAPPLSTSDITGLETLTSSLNFHYDAISSKEKVNRKNRNSKIEIFLN